MVGLEFIAKTFAVEYKTIAEQIGVTPVTIQHWLKGRKNISESRLSQLSRMFGLPTEYFGKELSTAEKYTVQLANLKRLARGEGYEVRFENLYEGVNPSTLVHCLTPYQGEIFHRFPQQYRDILITQIRDLLDTDNDEESRESYNMLSRVVRIMINRNKKELKTLGKVLRFIDEYDSPFANLDAIEGSDKPLLDAVIKDIKD